MGVSLAGGEGLVTASAKDILSTIGVSVPIFAQALTIRASKGNAGTIYIGKSDVTATTNRLDFLDPGEAWSIAINGWFSSGQIYIIGTVNDKVYVTFLQ